jgi:hypothetical protein
MTLINNIYDELASILAQLDHDRIMKLRASENTQERFDYLLDKHKYDEITTEEKEELDHFLIFDRLVRMAKIRADKAKANE